LLAAQAALAASEAKLAKTEKALLVAENSLRDIDSQVKAALQAIANAKK
jgi:hypothetical protein